jgi:hypothetical protein
MMKSEQLFYRELARNWGGRFPALAPVHLPETPQPPKGSNFICDKYYGERRRAYFFNVFFSQKRRGEFTLSVTISDSQQRSLLEGRSSSDLNVPLIGTYRIAAFMQRQDYWWAIKDVNAESSDLLRSFGIASGDFGSRPTPHRWRPTSYDLPFEKVVEEALVDLNEKISNFVLPKLCISLDK